MFKTELLKRREWSPPFYKTLNGLNLSIQRRFQAWHFCQVSLLNRLMLGNTTAHISTMDALMLIL